MNYLIKIHLLVILAFSMLIPTALSAAEIRVNAEKVNVGVGDQFLVNVTVYSTESVNTIEGQIVFPTDKLAVKEISDGNSVVNFWIERPTLGSDGIVSFSGITPGGFVGVNNHILSVIFEARETGLASIEMHSLKALLNDGSGTEVPLSAHNTAVSIKAGDSQVRKEKVIDQEPPEDFILVITEDQALFEGRKFLVFAAQDKISGIDHYEIREGEWGWFTVAESPYPLKHQLRDRKIFVKAIDKNGNERVMAMEAQYPSKWYQRHVLSGIILALIVCGFLIKILWLRFIK